MASKLPSRPSRPNNSRRTSAKQRSRQHMLDVKVRSQSASRQRQQNALSISLYLLIGLVLCVGLYFGVTRAASRLFFKNPDYSLAHLDVETDGVLSPAAVLAAADLQLGTNILKVDLDRARTRVATLPQVAKVEISRQMPNRVLIQITERKPIAWVVPLRSSAKREEIVASAKSYFIDNEGILLPPIKVLPQDTALPIIRNYAGELGPGRDTDGEEIHAALDLLHARQDSLVGARFQIEEIDLSKQFCIVVTDATGAQVQFGLEDIDRQLKRLDSIMDNAQHHGQKVQTINLLVSNNIPVTFQPEAPPDPMADYTTGTGAAPAPSPGAAGPAASPGKSSGVAKREKDSGGKSRKESRETHKSSRPKEREHSAPPRPAPTTAPAPTVRQALPLQPFH